ICHSADRARDIVEALRTLRGINASAFHEGLSIIERDRAGAWFAEQENGAQLLACSEIGSEGRNFQFAHHLVLFDLPANPDLLEQRIGRLDRIGQSEQVKIHFPYFADSTDALWQQWYHEGLNAFEHSSAIGGLVAAQQQDMLERLQAGDQPDIAEWQQFIEATAGLAADQRKQMEAGRDRLLEFNSHRPDIAAKVIDGIAAVEQELALQPYLEQVFDCFGVDSEEHSEAALIIQPGDHMHVGAFPGLPEDGMTATFSRDIAQGREDFHYLTWEHPLVIGALDLALSGDHGTAVVSATSIRGIPTGTVMVEAIFTLQARRVPGLDVRQFLPMVSLRCLWDYKKRDYGQHISPEVLADRCENVDIDVARQLIEHQRESIRTLLKDMARWARAQQSELVDAARSEMNQRLEVELERLEGLKQVNPSVRDEELEEIRLEMQVGNAVLDEAEGKAAADGQLQAVVDKHQPDFIGLQETKVQDKDFPLQAVEAMGYHVEFHGGKTHYGVALMSKQAPVSVQKGFPDDGEEAQRRMVMGTFETASGPVTVLNGYFPQGESRDHPVKFPAKKRFYADLLSYLQTRLSPTDRVVVMGDFNIAPVDQDIGIGPDNAKRWLRTGKTSFLPEEREWMGQLEDWGLRDTFRLKYPEVDDLFSWFDYRSDLSRLCR
ncbi:unnamed protein product, partial [Cyprideis torosa]